MTSHTHTFIGYCLVKPRGTSPQGCLGVGVGLVKGGHQECGAVHMGWSLKARKSLFPDWPWLE